MLCSAAMSLPLPADLPGIGVDLVDIARLVAALERGGPPLRDRMFTPAEQEECEGRPNPGMHYAARMAAKEAGMKVLGTGWTGGVGFQDFEVISDGRTAPKLRLHGQAAVVASRHGIREMRLSLSHTDTMAIAFVIGICAVGPGAGTDPGVESHSVEPAE